MEKINFNCIKCSNMIYYSNVLKNISFNCKNCGIIYEYNHDNKKITIDIKSINNHIKNIDYSSLDGCENWGIDG